MDIEATTTERIENTGFKQKCGAFFRENYAMFVAPAIVVVLYMLALWYYGVYPFGDDYTAASYDLSAQICPFIEHLFDVLQGKSTLTYSYAILGGADVTGTFLYFFISPFSFLFLIFGDGKVAYASSIVMACKLAAVAVAGAWFAKKLFRGIPDYICIAIGVAYAYCGYMFVANTYINWVDFLIYLPFCAWAFKRFVQTGKYLIFSLLMACCVYTCFSIACFSMFTVFPALIAYGLLCVEKERRHKFIAYLCLSFLITILLSLPVLLPALMAYTRSGRSSGIFDGLWYGFNLSDGAPTDFNSSSFINTYEESVYRKLSYIFSDAVFVALTLIWICRKGFKDPFVKFMIVAGALTLLPVFVDESMRLLNMGSYMSYALRFGFLNALYFLGGACLCIENICYKKQCAFDGKPLYAVATETQSEATEARAEEPPMQSEEPTTVSKPLKKRREKKPLTRTSYWIWLGVTVHVGLLLIAFVAWYAFGGYKPFLAWFTDDPEAALKNLNGFPAAFAHSLGGLEVVAILFIVAMVLVFLGAWLVSSKKISPKLLSFVLIAVVALQVTFYNQQLVAGNRSTQHTALGSYQVLNETLNSRNEGEYFRVKDFGRIIENSQGNEERVDTWTACAPFTGGSNAFSAFSSVIDADNFATYELFGYLGNGMNSYKSTHNIGRGNRSEDFGDAFLGYKYFLVSASERTEAEKKTYLQKVWELDENGEPVKDSNGKNVHLSHGGYYVYENTIVFPLAYRVKDGAYKFVSPNELNSDYRKKNLAELYRFLRGEELSGSSTVTAAKAKELSEYLWDKAAEEVEVGAGKITVRITAEAGECLFMNFVASKGYTVTVNGKKAELIDNDLKFLSVALQAGENEVVFRYSSPYVKYIAIGAGAAVVLLCAAAFVLNKTKVMEYVSPVISWAGIVLATGLVIFFMVYPTGVFMSKLVELLRGFLLK